MPSDTVSIKNAPLFDVNKWSEYPEVSAVVDEILAEVKALRSSENRRIRNWAKTHKHLKVIIIELWSAHKISTNPYRSISKNKSDYQIESRYRKIHIKYDYFIGLINDLVKLNYLEQKIGFRGNYLSYRTRIKASNRLLSKILNPEYRLAEVISDRGYISIISRSPEAHTETIILRNSAKDNIDYLDTARTTEMRSNLALINNRIAETRITLDINDTQYEDLITKLSSERNKRPTIDFTSNQLHRVFNNSSFENGGRFYGGWWQHIPKEYRKYITINRKPTVELDYSGHHIRILYSMERLAPPDDPYDITNFPREDQKQAILIMINADSEVSAIKAMSNQGIKKAKLLVNAIKLRNEPIQHYFSSGIGISLMYQDSVLAEKVMLKMLDRGATVLPLHDSFIVRNSYESELEEIMSQEFESIFGSKAILKLKRTVFDDVSRTGEHVRINIHSLISNDSNWKKSIWGFD